MSLWKIFKKALIGQLHFAIYVKSKAPLFETTGPCFDLKQERNLYDKD